MSFVFYDVETTGLRKGFDQILLFAAAQTDAELQVLDRFEIRSRILPHIIAAPGALHVMGTAFDSLSDRALPSHYKMVSEIQARLAGWCPAMFLGFNSIRFDEEFLRQAFYQCLYKPYLTNTGGSARADVLNLCRVVATLRPDVLQPHAREDGLPVFRLADLARANGVASAAAHVAMADVDMTLALCRHIKAGAPELWSMFLQFAQKAAVEEFLKDEEGFLFFEGLGDQHEIRLMTRIGQHSGMAIRQYCLDVHADVNALRTMTDDELVALLRGRPRPVIAIRTNRAPMLCALYDATPDQLGGLSEAEILDRVRALREEPAFLKRLSDAAEAAEPVYPESPHVEEQLYGFPFPQLDDEALMTRFHSGTWEERTTFVGQFNDVRYRRLARRLVYFERPDLLGPAEHETLEAEIRRRMLGSDEAQCPWLTIPAALGEIERLLDEIQDAAARARLVLYAEYLRERLGELEGNRGHAAPVLCADATTPYHGDASKPAAPLRG